MKPTDVPVQKHRDAEAQATMPTGVEMRRRNLGFGTILVAVTAWIIVLAAQISLARTGNADTPPVGVLWFALALQAILVVVVACDPSQPNPQTTALSGVLLVFASLGIERHAPRASTQPASAALVAGWGLLALVDLFWLFTDGGRSSLLPAWVETIRVSSRMRSILAMRNKPQANTNVARGRTISNPSAPKPAIPPPSQDNQRPRAMVRLDVDSLLKTPPNTPNKAPKEQHSSSTSTTSTSTGSPVVRSLSFSPPSNKSPGQQIDIADRTFIIDSDGPDHSESLDVEEMYLHLRNAVRGGHTQRRAVYYDPRHANGGQSRRQLSTIYDLDAEEDDAQLEEGDLGEIGEIQDEDEAEAGRDTRAADADAFPYTVRAKSSCMDPSHTLGNIFPPGRKKSYQVG
ncbi:SH3 domain-containing protein [Mycena chlorophos]|uniref:SH3 domain-containing protein n=1 Tax=Mycena chlorophos TaxID=658473 RepID=A0A8H6VZ02_MYCCL|nr:SH3 domain-containing protein [Mycena chlorophos]